MCRRKLCVLSAAATFCLCVLGQVTAADLPVSSKQGATVGPATNADDAVLKRLSDTPVSVLDYGLEMMWRDLDEAAKGPLHYYGTDGAFPAQVSITYDPKGSKIFIAIESNPGTEGGAPLRPLTKEKWSPAEVWCRTLINKLRSNLSNYAPNNPPKWLKYFAHGDHYVSGVADTEIAALNSVLPQRVFLRAHSAVILGDDAVHCMGPLIGSEISVERESTEIVE
jgi:hypothetical protein